MSDNLTDLIRQDRANGLTYAEIMKKHNLKSNYLIKVALGKTLGTDEKYKGRHRERFRQLKETEKKYFALVKLVKKFIGDLEVLTSAFNSEISKGSQP